MPKQIFDLRGKRIYIAGHKGMVGAALMRALRSIPCTCLIVDRSALDLTNQVEVGQWFQRERPDAVFLAAAKVGGIGANNIYRAEFIYENLMIAANIIHAAYKCGVAKLMYFGSTCVYPKFAQQPMSEDQLLAGPIEPTNEPYAIAKIAGIKLAEAYRVQYGCDFISVMPTNLYGPGDNYDSQRSHVVAALLRRFHEAKIVNAPSVLVWGTGTPRREFLYIDDFAEGCLHIVQIYSDQDPINIGVGEDISIAEFAKLVAEVVGYAGKIVFDTSKPDGTLRKLVDISRLSALGWVPKTSLREGMHLAYEAYLAATTDGGAVGLEPTAR